MSLLVSLLQERDFEGARALIAASPASVVCSAPSSSSSGAALGRSPVRGVLEFGANTAVDTAPASSGSSTLPPSAEDPTIFYALGDVETLEHLLLQSPESAWAHNRAGDRPLHAACQQADIHIDVISILLFAFPEGASIKNNAGKFALHFAAANIGDLSIFKLLYEAFERAISEKETKNFSMPLHYACAFKAPLQIVQFLVKKNREAIREKDRQGNLPLLLSLLYDSPEDVRLFLLEEFPEAVEVRDRKGRLPIHLAVQSQTISTATVRKILTLSPDYSINSCVLHEGEGEGHGDTNNSSSTTGAGAEDIPWMANKKPVHIALRYLPTRVDILKCLLTHASYKDSATATAPAVSISKLQNQKTKRAIESNESVEVAETAADTTFSRNEEQTDTAAFSSSIEASAEEEQTFYLHGDTLLHTAIEFGSSPDVLGTITKLKPSSLKELNNDGKLPIHFAAWRQVDADTMVFLIREFPESLGIEDEKTGNLPLHFALQYAHTEKGGTMDTRMIEKVLSYRASACLVMNKAGFYPIHLATRSACPLHILEVLLKVSPYSYAFYSQNYLRLLPVDMAIASGASADVIGLMLGYKDVSTSIKAKRVEEDRQKSPLMAHNVDGEVVARDLQECEEMITLTDAHIELQKRFKDQGEEMRKLRAKMHSAAADLKSRNAECLGLQKDISWRDDKVQILKKEVKALQIQLASFKNNKSP